MDEPAVLDSLKNLRLMSVLSSDMIRLVYSRMTTEKLAAKTTLFRKGDQGGALYLILEGKVAVILPHDDGTDEVLNHLGPGDAMGQMSLIDPGLRTATAVAVTDVCLMRLHRDDFQDIIRSQSQEVLTALGDAAARQRLGYMDILKQLPLFHNMSDEALAHVGDRLSIVRLRTGEALFHKGDPGDSLYIVDDGRLKITTKGSGGEELILNDCGPGEVIGEMGPIDYEPRSATVVATSSARLLRLSREDFWDIASSQPIIAMDIMRNMSSRLRFATTYIEQAIEWSRHVAEGDYGDAINQIEHSQTGIERGAVGGAAKATELLSAFFQMVRDVQQREEILREQVRILTIQIDEARRHEEVHSLTESDSFARLKEQAARLRAERDDQG